MEIKNFKPIDKGMLKSVFTVSIPEWGNIEIDCAYFEKGNGSYWINYAVKEYVNKEGKKKSFNQVRWPQAVVDRLSKAIREKVKEEEVKTGFVPIEPSNEEEVPF
jgi:hypothetical protein